MLNAASGPFPPTRAVAQARIDALQPAEYARSRNLVDGCTTGLSPYITHGIVSLPEVLAGVAARHPLHVQHAFVFELGWRAYFRHVWRHRGEAILRSLHDGPLPDDAYAHEVPADLREARTGVPAIDTAVRTLYATGVLHNHARLWLASYVVHLRKVHWRAGADWLLSHLLDGDLASNHLSWQWVAGTGSSKPYLFNADNVARCAPAAWHSPGSVIDQSYDTMDALARSRRTVQAEAVGDGVEEPARVSIDPAMQASVPRAEDVVGRDVWLVHPWALGEPPADLPCDGLRLGIWPTTYHEARPWQTARWRFAATRMAELTTLRWHAPEHELAVALAGARSVHTIADPHVGAHLPPQVVQRAPASLFPEVDRPCTSFSAWWKHAVRGIGSIADLPGLATRDAPTRPGHVSSGSRDFPDESTPHESLR